MALARAPKTTSTDSSPSSLKDLGFAGRRALRAARSTRASSSSRGRHLTESAIAPTSSSTGTRRWRNGPSNLPRAGERSAKGVVQPSKAAPASTSTPTIEKRMKLLRPPRPTLSEPRWTSGRPPETRASAAPASRTPPSHHGSLGLIPRGRRAARKAMSTERADNPDRLPRGPDKQPNGEQSEGYELGTCPHAVKGARPWHEPHDVDVAELQVARPPALARSFEQPCARRAVRRHVPLLALCSRVTRPASRMTNRSPSSSALSRSCETTTVARPRSSRKEARIVASPSRASSSSPA